MELRSSSRSSSVTSWVFVILERIYLVALIREVTESVEIEDRRKRRDEKWKQAYISEEILSKFDIRRGIYVFSI